MKSGSDLIESRLHFALHGYQHRLDTFVRRRIVCGHLQLLFELGHFCILLPDLLQRLVPD